MSLIYKSFVMDQTVLIITNTFTAFPTFILTGINNKTEMTVYHPLIMSVKTNKQKSDNILLDRVQANRKSVFSTKDRGT